MKKTFFKLFLLTLIVIIAFSSTTFVKADDANLNLNRTTGTITVNRLEEGVAIEGITFDIYKVSDDETSRALPTDENVIATKQTAITDSNGKVTFSDLPLGRYLIVESKGKDGVKNKVVNILVDLPTTVPGETVDTLNYDLNITPKTYTEYGSIILTNIGKTAEKTENIEGSEFSLQIKNGDTWEEVSKNTTLVTNSDGTITIEGLEDGEYRFIQESVPDDYILDNKAVYEFEVTTLTDGTTEVSVDGTAITTGEGITVINEKPGIKKEITDTLVNESVIIGQEVNYKLTVELIPTTIERLATFEIKDVFSLGLDYDTTSLVITGVDSNGNSNILDTSTYTAEFDSETKALTINIQKSELAKYESIECTYKAKVNSDAPANENGIKNTASLEYSLVVEKNQDDVTNTETVETLSKDITIYTGGFWIKKTAEKENGKALEGAVFRIAASKQDAKNGNYLKDIDGNIIEITSDANGKASYKGLEIGAYWLVEIKAPTYKDSDGEVKSYNLLREPVEIEVSKTSYESDTPTKIVVNKTGFQLPKTGGPGAILLIGLGIILIVVGVKTMKSQPKKEK